jgi:ubiquinone/menaquinone biosynthesis C-methylase UbiE
VSTDTNFTGSIPEIYDRLFVPLIFEPYARDLAARMSKAKPRNVLETAAGTGALTRENVSLLNGSARIDATDLNQAMLDRARARQGEGAVEWRQADALALPFGDQSFDVVACQFGVMFLPDKVAGYAEARRVLRTGGVFLFNVWDRIETNDFTSVVTEALAVMFPDDPPRFMARTPHGYHDPDRIRAELVSAGFADIAIELVEHRSTASSPREAAMAICGGSPLRTEIEMRGRFEDALDHATAALARRFGEGQIEGRIRALVATAPR